VTLALVVILVVAVAASAYGAWRLIVSPRRVLSPERETMRDALLHATATLPHLRRGLDASSARAAAPHLRMLTQAVAVAITNADRVLADDGVATQQVSPERLLELSRRVVDGRVHVEPRVDPARSKAHECAAVVAPLIIQDHHVGSLIAL
jgi:two-component system, LytTR family, sensor kinase